MGIVAGGERMNGTRVGVGWRVAVGPNERLGFGTPDAAGFCIMGRNGSYVGKLVGTEVERVQETSRLVSRRAQMNFCNGMNAILPVEIKIWIVETFG